MKGRITLQPLRDEKYNEEGWPVFDKETGTFENIVETKGGTIEGEEYTIQLDDAYEFMVKLEDDSIVELSQDDIDMAMGCNWWDYYTDEGHGKELDFEVKDGVASAVLGEVDLKETERGFGIGKFEDRYGAECSIQVSSIATEDCIWLGVDDPDPRIMASQARDHGVETDQTTGWVKYPIPEEVLINTRMHLSRENVKKLLPLLQRFVETGSIYPQEDEN